MPAEFTGLKSNAAPPIISWMCALLCTTEMTWAHELDFYKDIFPSLEANCVSCHNKTTSKAGLNLETPESIQKGGDSGPALIPGKGAESLIVRSAAHKTDTAMPPKNNKSGAVDLSSNELERLALWIDQGAKPSVKEGKQIVWQPLSAGINPIYAVALTGDGRLSACTRGNRVFLYDLLACRFVSELADPSLSQKGSMAAHRSVISSVAFSPDGNRIATGAFREAKIWRREAVPGKRHTLPTKPDQQGDHFQPTPDGRWLVAISKDRRLQVLDAVSAQPVRSFAIELQTTTLMRVSPDSTRVLLASENAPGGVWSLVTGERVTFPESIPPLTAANWSRDSSQLFLVNRDKTVQVVDIATKPTTEPPTPKGIPFESSAPVVKVERGPNTDTLLIHEGEKVLLWSIPQNKSLHEFKAGAVSCISTSTDGKRLAVGSQDGSVRIFESESAKQLHEFHGTSKTANDLAHLNWKSSRAALDIAFQKDVLAKLDIESKGLENHFKKTTDAVVAAKKALPEKKKAAEAASDAVKSAQKAADEAASTVTTSTENKPSDKAGTKQKEATTKLDADISAEKSALAAVTAAENSIRDGEENLQRIEAGRAKNSAEVATANAATESAKSSQTVALDKIAEIKRREDGAAAACVSVGLSADGNLVAAVLNSGWVQIWSTATGGNVEGMEIGHPITSAEFLATSPDHFEIFTAEWDRLTTARPDRWILERTIGNDSGPESFAERVSSVRFSPDGKALATGSGEFSRGGDIHFWDASSGKLSMVWRDKHKDSVLALDFSSDGKLLASGAADRLAKVTEVGSGKQIYSLEAHTHHVMGVSFRADDKTLATSGGDGVVNIWDMESGERKKKIVGWSKEVTALQYIGASSQIVTSAGDNQVRIVSDDGTEVRAMSKLPDFMQSTASAHTVNLVVAGGEDSALRVWDSATGKQLAIFSSP